MAKNSIASGTTLNYTNTTGSALAMGAGVVVGTTFGVVLNANSGAATLANSATGVVAICGVFELPKVSADVIAQGATVYFDNATKLLTTTVASNLVAGKAYAAAGNPTSTAQVILNGVHS